MPVYMDDPIRPKEAPKSFTIDLSANPELDGSPGKPPAPPVPPRDPNEERQRAFKERVDALVGLGSPRAVAERLVLLECRVYGDAAALGIEK